MKAIIILKEMYQQGYNKKYPNLPYPESTVERYTDKDVKGLIKCIVDFLQLQGHNINWVSFTDNFFEEVDCKNPYIDSDIKIHISATVNDRRIIIEAKPINEEYGMFLCYQSERDRGIYLVCDSFQNFYDWYNSKFALVKSLI